MGPGSRWQPFCAFMAVCITLAVSDVCVVCIADPLQRDGKGSDQTNIVGYRLLSPDRGDEEERMVKQS